MVNNTFYKHIGGKKTIESITHRFYKAVKEDPILAPMYPDSDFEGAEKRLSMFLEQYWGGPITYSEQRGHPRLRMRHAPFKVNPAARDAWLKHMNAAIKTEKLAPIYEIQFLSYVDNAAHAMVNTFED
ncbi:MAG: globin [Micrococcaceae bacterium]